MAKISVVYICYETNTIWCLEKLMTALTLKCDTWHTLNDVTFTGNEAVGKESSVSFKFGWTAEAHRFPGLEVVEVPSETAAARDPLFSTFSRLTSLYALRCWILQPGHSSGLDILCKAHVKTCGSLCMWLWRLCLSYFSHRRRVAADSMHAKRNVCWCGQGAGHRSLNILQATLCVCPQVCLESERRIVLYPKLPKHLCIHTFDINIQVW